jgi:glucosamine-6-phosphate deaminase
MRLIIHDDPRTVAHWVATYVKKRILAFAPTPERPFVLGLPTGSSPLTVYKKLIEFFKAGDVSFANVITFNMDEYVGLEVSHPESYHSYMYECVERSLGLPPPPPCSLVRAHLPSAPSPFPAQELFQAH